MNKRFECQCTSCSTGFTNYCEFDTLQQAENALFEGIHDSSYAVQIWDNKKSDFIVWQQA